MSKNSPILRPRLTIALETPCSLLADQMQEPDFIIGRSQMEMTAGGEIEISLLWSGVEAAFLGISRSHALVP